MHDTILQLKANNSEELQEGSPYELWKNAAECFQWANHMGQFAISTLRITAIYLYRANKIIQDLPYVQLSSGNDTELLRHLTRVGSALGGQFGICEELHDSLGNYMLKEDGSIMNYREFCCSEIFNKINWLWFLKMFDFYGDFHLKTANERQEMIKSLQALCTFLQEAGADAGVHV